MSATRQAMLDTYERAKTTTSGRPVKMAHGNVAEDQVRRWLRDFLPIRYGVTSGFVISSMFSSREPLKHYDVIIYDALNAPTLWLETGPGEKPDRAIPAEHVLAILEVKSALTRNSTKSAIAKLEELHPLLEEIDASGERYPVHLPAFWCGCIFFELREKDARLPNIFDGLVPAKHLRGYTMGLILKGDRASGSGRIEMFEDHGPNRETPMSGEPYRIAHSGGISRPSDGTARALIHWMDWAFSRTAFDMLARLNGTYNPIEYSSFHGFGGPEAFARANQRPRRSRRQSHK